MPLASVPEIATIFCGATGALRRACILLGCLAVVAMLSVLPLMLQPAQAAGISGGEPVPVFSATTASTTDASTRQQRASTFSVEAVSRWIMTTQANLNRALTSSVRGLNQNPWQGSLLLVAIAFAYGILHAAGPGHGKAVIASYVLANGATVRRGVALSFMAAAIQALAALLLVGVLVVVMGLYGRSALAAERWLEIASWAAIALVGAWLLYRQLAPMLGMSTGHAHDDGCGCPEHHVPPAHLLTGEWSWHRALAIAVSVGIRPCTGAILLLTFAIGQGLFWAGVLGTLAMALGTAITVSALALMAVHARQWSIALWGRESRIGGGVAHVLSLLAAILVISIGVTGMHAALTAPRAPDFLLMPRS